MLLPDPSYSTTTAPMQANSFMSGYIGTPLTSNTDDSGNYCELYQGNLVNIANGFDVHKLHQMQTSLNGPLTKVFQQGKEITVVIYDPQTTSASQQADGYSSGTGIATRKEIDLVHEAQSPVHDIPQPPPADFDVLGYEDEDEDAGDEAIDDTSGNSVQQPVNAVDATVDMQVNAIPNTAANHCFTGGSAELDALVELYSMLDKRGVSNVLFDKITKWAWLNARTFGNTPPMKRDVVVEKVFRAVRGDNYKEFMYPKQRILELSTGRHVAVTYFPIENMIKDLLNNSTLMERRNLLFSNFSDPTEDNCRIDPTNFGELNTGTWWNTAKEHECREVRDVLWPLILFIDGMKVDNISGKLKLEPISFTFSRFRRFMRHQDNAWRTWAYMEDVKQPTRTRPIGEEDPLLTSKQRLQEYHDILAFLMDELKVIQRNGLRWTFDFAENGKHDVILRLPIQFIIGDCEGHDKLAGRFKGHTHNIKGLCRDCDVPTHCGDDENWVCSYFVQSEMDNLTEEELRSKSFHNIENGLQGVSTGGSTRGIFGILLPEMLHLYKYGHCDWQSDSFIYSLSSRSTEITTQVSAFLVNTTRGQSDRSYPDIGTFRDGVIKSQGIVLMGHEKHARIFFIYLMLCCSEFVRSLDYNRKRGTGYDKVFYQHFAHMLEQSLGFYEWSMKREHAPGTIIGNDGTHGSSIAQQSIRRYLGQVKRCCLREDMGKSYKMPKFHQTLHLVSAVESHGSLLNVDGSRPESMAKGNVKDPASHSQRVNSKLSYQTGKRYIESLTFREYKRLKKEIDPCSDFGDDTAPYINSDTVEAQMVMNDLSQDASVVDDTNPNITTAGSTKFSICLDLDQPEGQYTVTIEWLGKGKKPLRGFDEHLVQQLGKRLFGATDGGVIADAEVTGCTSVSVQGTKYTAHPMYGNDHLWHDWVYIQWDGYAEPIPARIDMIIDLRQSEILNCNPHDPELNDINDMIRDFDHQFLEKKIYAVVWSAKSLSIPRHKLGTYHIPLNLAIRVELESFRRIVPVESFVKPCYGMLNYCGLDEQFDMTAIILKDRTFWSDFFLGIA
jgi:hypothetical protein